MPTNWGSRSFNGTTDLVNAGTAAILNPNGAGASMTGAVWIYPTSFPNAYNPVIGRSDGATHYYVLQPKSTGKMALYYIDNGGVSRNYDPGNTTISTNVWSHLAFVIPASGKGEGYINAVLDAQCTIAGTGITTISASTCFGGDNHGAFFAGRLADAAIWNVNLLLPELKALANGARPWTIRPGNLVGYWPLDGLQSPEPDLTGNKNNGTLTGTAAASGPPYAVFTPRWPQGLDVFVPPPAFVLMPQIVT